MNLRWIVLGLALLCVAQVWAKPANKTADDNDYQEDDIQEDKVTDYDDDSTSSGPAVVLSKPETLFVQAGANVSLPCEFLNAESLVIEWRTSSDLELYVDAVKMVQDSRIHRGENNNSLTISNVSLQDTGEYKCSALSTTPVVIVHKLFVLLDDNQVRVLPNEENDVIQDTSLTLTCLVGGGLKPTSMYWSREGIRLKSEKIEFDGRIRAVSLPIKNATRHVAGDYQCGVEIGAAVPIIKHLKLRVQHAPEIEYDKERVGEHMHHISHYVTSIGADINITCLVHAHPGVTKLNWVHDGSIVNIDNYHYFKNDIVRSHHVLGIKNVTKADLGSWHCKAYNALGERVGPEMIVSDAPGKPRFQVGEVVNDAIKFHWKAISYKPIKRAEFLYRKEGEDDSKWKQGKVDVFLGIGKEYVIVTMLSGIEPGKYEAKVRTSNDVKYSDGPNVKWGPYSDIKKFDGEYGKTEASTSQTGSAAIPISSMTSLLLIMVPLAYACL